MFFAKQLKKKKGLQMVTQLSPVRHFSSFTFEKFHFGRLTYVLHVDHYVYFFFKKRIKGFHSYGPTLMVTRTYNMDLR